jgi:carbonic anhydrase
VSQTDALIANNETYAASFDCGDLAPPPARKLAIVACMDARLNIYAALGLREGDAHVLRNAGGAVTDDMVRSLAISQTVLGTEEIILIHHTGCGMLTLDEDEFRAQLHADSGVTPAWPVEAFQDLEQNVRDSIARIEASPFIARKDAIRGFVYECETGRLREVT